MTRKAYYPVIICLFSVFFFLPSPTESTVKCFKGPATARFGPVRKYAFLSWPPKETPKFFLNLAPKWGCPSGREKQFSLIFANFTFLAEILGKFHHHTPPPSLTVTAPPLTGITPHPSDECVVTSKQSKVCCCNTDLQTELPV
ncbi:Protein CBG27183 [Caenorhabditis briggsae]|uniref:Protein CBG27183 n=1 Tax=Caenorhabditis briggsae TaxID=6238 RepID=B6IL93_CAEBR|nr:Protein CBG27183 [Caenorhabditis briggsae]CAS00646.1 Protein CBG27183 [Caenorhabditis briggsae]